jgi:MFS family permease
VMIGMIGSVYSISQIVGGLVLGVVSDRLEDRRSVLLLSIFGAAISYAMVGMATSIPILLLSRVVVGAVKQTMTVSKALAAMWSDDDTRAASMGVMSSAATAAWVSGSAVTGFVYKLNPYAPSILAVMLYVIDACIVKFVLPPALRIPHEHDVKEKNDVGVDDDNKTKDHAEETPKRPSFLVSFHRAFGNRSVALFVVIKLLYEFIARSSIAMQVCVCFIVCVFHCV